MQEDNIIAGQLCSGHTLKNGLVRDSKAYCEGMAYRASGIGTDVPVTDNPHQTGSDAWAAWLAGWNAADAYSDGVMPVNAMGCCSIPSDIPASIPPP